MTENDPQCYDLINGNFLNRCFIVNGYDGLRQFTQTFFKLVYPTIITSVIIILITLLPFVFELSSKQLYRKSLRLYNVVRFTLLSLFHRVSYCYSLCSIIRYLINQSDPCQCSSTLENIQNMPYIYTCSAVMVAMTLVDFAKFSPKVFYFLAAFICIVPSTLYILCGYVSVGQVLATTFFFIAIHIYSTKSSNRVMFVESIILFLANIIAAIIVAFKEEMTKFSVRNSPVSVMIRGLLCNLFVILHDLMFLIQNKWGYFTIQTGLLMVENEQTSVRSAILSSDDEIAIFHQTMKNDKIYGIIILVVIIIGKSGEYVVENYLNPVSVMP